VEGNGGGVGIYGGVAREDREGGWKNGEIEDRRKRGGGNWRGRGASGGGSG